MNIILLAAPGAGKGTQADLISSNYGFKHISTGDLLREALLKEDDMAKTIKTQMELGKLVSDDIILSLIKDVIADKDKSYIFDGFPRTINQAVMMDKLFLETNQEIDYVIHIIVDKEILKNRIIGRVTCPKCKAIFNENILEHRPKVEGICDRCGSKLVKRQDDSAETFEDRYKTYLEETKPLIDYYRNLNKLVEIDTGENKYTTFDKIKSILEGEK